MIRVYTAGTFDTFHIGHLNILKRCKEHGDYLLVGVSTDEFNALKGKKSLYPFEHRLQIIAGLRCVDEVRPESSWEEKREVILQNKIDKFIIADDWAGKFDGLKDICEVIYLPRTPDISSSLIRGALGN
jgi:glycerol-3-phosphate cytidylyltransferase